MSVEEDKSTRETSEVKCCVKFAFFSLNGIVFLVGTVFLAVGIWANIEKGGMLSMLSKVDKERTGQDLMVIEPTLVIIFIGLIMFEIGSTGSVGALRENIFYLTLYTTSVGVLIIMELALILFLVLAQGLFLEILRSKINDTIILYREDDDLRDLVDFMQITFKCCGGNSPSDWNENIYFSNAKELEYFRSPERGGVPYSCCISPYGIETNLINYECGYKARMHFQGAKVKGPIETQMPEQREDFFDSSVIHGVGCVQALVNLVKGNIIFVIIGVGSLLFTQFICLAMGWHLSGAIFAQRKKWYSLVEQKKRERRGQV